MTAKSSAISILQLYSTTQARYLRFGYCLTCPPCDRDVPIKEIHDITSVKIDFSFFVTLKSYLLYIRS
jgi:hypothetical protein